VSVVLPVYNQSDLLPQAIQGVVCQTYTSWELIIVNDGSTDDVDAAVAPFRHDPRIRLLTQPNQRLPSALNNGFARARGELLTWTSADNVMLPRQLETLVETLRANPHAGLAYSDYLAIDDAGKPLRDPSFRPHNRPDPASPVIRLPDQVTLENFHLSGDNFIGPSFLYRADVASVVGRYDENAFGAEDYDYWLRMHLVSPFVHAPHVLYQYRVHANSVSARVWEWELVPNIQMMLEVERERRGATLRAERLSDVAEGFWRSPDQYRVEAVEAVHVIRRARSGQRTAPVLDGRIAVLALEGPLQPDEFGIAEQAEIVVVSDPVTYARIRQEELPFRIRLLAAFDRAAPLAIKHAVVLRRFENALEARGHAITSKPPGTAVPPPASLCHDTFETGAEDGRRPGGGASPSR